MIERDGERPAGRDPDAQPRGEVEHYEESSHFLFRLADSLYGLPATAVDHVADAEPPLTVPTAPEIIIGVLHLRGRIVGVIDIAALLGLPAIELGELEGDEIGTRLVVVESGGRYFGLFVEETLGIQDVRLDHVRPMVDDGSGLFSGQFDHPRGVVTVLDPEAVFSRATGQAARGESVAAP